MLWKQSKAIGGGVATLPRMVGESLSVNLSKALKKARASVMQVSKKRALGLEKTARAKALRQPYGRVSEEL